MKRTGFILLTLVLCLPLFLLAQPPGDPGGGTDPDVPITGIEILLAMGGFLGLRKLFTNKKENN
jgi:hypothetical protein